MATRLRFADSDLDPEVQARAEVKPGFSLPAYYYNDAGRYAQDMAQLRETMWWVAGHVAQVPARGDYFLFDIDGESIIITRARDGAINAFYNVCRHRGSRVCLERSGNAKLMVCPYHAWSYDSDGRLVGAPDMPDGFDKQEFGLHRAHVGVVEGFICVSLATGTPPSFDTFVERLKPAMKVYRLASAKVAVHDVLPCAANWKLVIENFAECYHCPGSHREFSRVHRLDSMMAYKDDTGGAQDWLERMQAAGLAYAPTFDGPESPHLQSNIRLQLGNDVVSSAFGGKAVGPLLGDLPEWTNSWSASVFNPMCQIACYDDHAILFSFIPRGPHSTDCICLWLVRGDAVAWVDYNPDEVASMWRHTIREDKTICENNQLGVSSTAYRPGPYSRTESRAQESVEWYLHNVVDRAA